MIISKQLSNQIVAHWEIIKYAAIMANGLQESTIRESYCRDLLCNLLSKKYNCWMAVDDKREIRGVAITKIYTDAGNIPHLLIESLYVYKATTDNERVDFINTIKEFASGIECHDVIFYTANQRIMDTAEKLGFEESYKVYRTDIGGSNGRK